MVFQPVLFLRLFKLPGQLETTNEDYGQFAVYKVEWDHCTSEVSQFMMNGLSSSET